MKEHLVSVLTPVYNGAAYISRLLDSILRQTYSDIEMILVDDGSDDSTVEIANSYIPEFELKGYSLTVISCIHKNASAAINAGLPYVNGQYLVWPDSDDELLPDSIEVRVQFLESHQDYHCVRSIMEYVSDETGAPIERGEPLGDLNNEELFWDVLEQRSFVCCGCYMLETEPFFQIYPDKKIIESDVGQNFQMLLPFLFKYRCPTIERKLYRVHVRLDSHSHRKKDDQIYFECLIDEILRICSIKNKADLLRADVKKIRCREQICYARHQYFKAVKYKMIVQWLRIKRFFFQTLERSGLSCGKGMGFIIHICGNILFGVSGACYRLKYYFVKRKFQKLKIHSIDDTLNEIICERVSVSRFGDGEFHWMCMDGHKSFQRCSEMLCKRLKEVLESNVNKHIVCIPQELAGLDRDTSKRHRRIWKWIIGKYGACWVQLLNFNRDYYNTSVSRPYVKYLSKEQAKKWFLSWKTVWDARDVLIIEGEQTRFGIGNKLLDNARRIERIIAPPQNAFDKYDTILDAGKQFGVNKLILIALGPTATVLACDLAKMGYWAIDIGHLDVEYEWYLSDAKKKTPVRGKYVYEAGGEALFTELRDAELEEYRSQIIAHI